MKHFAPFDCLLENVIIAYVVGGSERKATTQSQLRSQTLVRFHHQVFHKEPDYQPLPHLLEPLLTSLSPS